MKNKISILDYNIMKNQKSPLDEGTEPLKPKRTRKAKHTFKLSDIKKLMLNQQVSPPNNKALNLIFFMKESRNTYSSIIICRYIKS
jgi:hypothetical protein